MHKVLLCGHHSQETKGHRLRCLDCGSFFDLDYVESTYTYDRAYPEERGHFDPTIGEAKLKTFRNWLIANQIEMTGKNVCELGFGGGHTLKEIHAQAKRAFGVEIEETNLSNAARLGIPPEQLFSYNALPDKMPVKIDLWVFQDSFEHVLAPLGLINWLNNHSAKDARILMVLPRADSISQMILGKLWPHKLPDHQFHWSKTGLEQFMQSQGWQMVRSFYPKKFVSINMILRHLILKLGLKYRTEFLSGLFLQFNIGEMGLVFQKKTDSALKVAS